MKKLSLLFLVSMVFIFNACDDKEEIETTTDFTVNINATYGDETFLTFKDYTYPDGRKILFNNFNFFVSDIVLISSETTPAETDFQELDYINLSYNDTQLAEAEAGKSISKTDLPVGNYIGLKLGFGVKADLNRSKPAEYGAGHPLTNNYWDGWSSYIFSMIEGGADMDENGEIVLGGADTESFTYHSGTDEVYVEKTINQTITLDENVNALTLTIDVQKLFKTSDANYDLNNDGYLDIETFRGTHSAAGEMTIAKQIMNNFATAISVK